MSRTFKEMEKMYAEVVKRFNKIELQAWNAEGEVADVDERLGNEMADVIAQVMRLADFYQIDLEGAFIEAREDEDRYLKSRGV